ncbi:MAG: hypothetical protein ABR607_16245 [Pyrinomonadaceae bacterium]
MAEIDSAGLPDQDAPSEVKLKSFAPGELLTCEVCLRTNPPTRAACIYCGARLTSSVVNVTPETEKQQPEAGAAAICYAVVPPKALSQVHENAMAQLAGIIKVKSSDLKPALISQSPVLVAGTRDKANQVVEDLRQIGIDGMLVTAEDLKLSIGSRTMRAFEVTDDNLAGLTVSSDARLPARWDELMLVVVGRLQTQRNEIEERRRRGGMKPIDRRQVADDEAIFDLYVRSSETAWRVAANNFDFSCLAGRKTLTAFENFRALINLLEERATIVANESYLRVRPLLADVWPLQQQTRKGAWRRSGAGKYDISTVTTTDNEMQFNNYSRLLWFLKTNFLIV